MSAEATIPDLHPLQTVAACTAGIVDNLDQLPDGPLPVLEGASVEGLIQEVARAEARLAELRLRLMRVADETREAELTAASGTDAWLARLTGTHRAVMAGGLWLARMMQERYPSVREAFARGELGEAHCRVIVQTAEKLPAGVSESDRDDAVEALVERAVQRALDPTQLRRVARRMLDRVSAELADLHEKELLEGEERYAANETWFALHDNHDGTWSGRFTIPALHGHLLETVLEHLSAPRRLGRNSAGEVVVDASLPADLNWSERLGQALLELIEHLPTEGWSNHGRLGASVMVHLSLQHLLDGLGSARLDSGAEISAGQARRLACNAGLIPAVFGGRSVPLDLGRRSRLHSTAQRAALSAVHDTCAAEGCQRPFAWTEIHHPDPWSRGGRTDLANALPLCGWHHRRAHDPGFDLRRLSSGEVRYRRRR